MLQFDTINTNNILLLSSIDSTNNYAHQLIMQQNNLHNSIIVALQQTNGRGQRGNQWMSKPNESLLMSIIIDHQGSQLPSQFVLNMAVCLAIAESIYTCLPLKKCSVKWSNDIYIGNHKIAGVLIENIIRGTQWTQSIIGIGINVNNAQFNNDLANATSIYLQSGAIIHIETWRNELIRCINQYLLWAKADEEAICNKYNEMLYKANEMQLFYINDKIENCKIIGVQRNGEIILEHNQMQASYAFGSAKQVTGNNL